MQFDRSLIGKAIRAKREEFGLVAKELADQNLTQSVISRIENGSPNVSQDKIQYLMKKLNIEMNDIPLIIQNDKLSIQKIQLKIKGIEDIIASDEPDIALQQLKDLNVKESNPYYPYLEMLRGKCFIKKRHYEKACSHLQEAIRLVDVAGTDELNIKSNCYRSLGFIAFHQSNYPKALNYYNLAIDAFNEEGANKHCLYVVKFNKAGLLNDLGYKEAFYKLINELWDQRDDIDVIDFRIQLHELKARYLMDVKSHDDAISILLQGIDLSQNSKKPYLSIHLWNALGDVYRDKKDYDEAEFCYLTAVRIKKPENRQHLTISSYLNLSKLYTNQQQYDKANEKVQIALELSEKCKDQFIVCDVFFTSGELLIQQNKYEQAINPLQEALSIAEAYEFKQKQIEILKKLGNCYKQIGNMDKYVDVLIKKDSLEIELDQRGA